MDKVLQRAIDVLRQWRALQARGMSFHPDLVSTLWALEDAVQEASKHPVRTHPLRKE